MSLLQVNSAFVLFVAEAPCRESTVLNDDEISSRKDVTIRRNGSLCAELDLQFFSLDRIFGKPAY